KVIGDRLGKAARSASGRSKDAIHDARARREAIRADQRTRTSLGSAPVTVEIESPAPLLPAAAGAPPSRSQSNVVLMIMAGFVALACLLGGIGVSRIGSGTDLGRIFGGDETTAVQTTESSSESEGGSGGDGEPLGVINAAGFDPPPGDGAEHNAEVPRVYDGNPSTIWTTEGYNSESFGGVKQGVGITVDLGQAQKISSVTLDLPTTAQATVYAGDQATNSGTEIGKTEGKTGQVVLTPSSEVTGQYVTVWFTSLAPSDDGRYRAALGEIAVR
ncbi:MAG: discoidin domain-containing protein, partial [Janibacter sp.]|nr:discoidin domain-containing protein [Janibacter sp.]